MLGAMPYGQILALIMALLLVASAAPNPAPVFSLALVGLLIVVKALAWRLFANWFVARARGRQGLHARIQRLQLLALVMLAVDFYALDLKSHLVQIPGSATFPSLVDIVSLLLYAGYLVVVWVASWRAEARLGHPVVALWQYVSAHGRLLLPAIVPYLVLSLVGDLLAFLPWPGLTEAMREPAGQLAFLGLFAILVVFMVPPLVRRLWACVPLPPGPARRVVEDFLKREGVDCSEILLWPLSGGQACTAAVLGLAPRWRYILLTPCLIEQLTTAELEAVLAHEIAHIRHRHLLWYLFFLGAYGLVLYLLFDPVWTWLLSQPVALEVLMALQESPQAMVSLLAALPLMALVLLYFRYLIGYFMRRFERQADLHIFKIQGQPGHLIHALEKVAFLSGEIRNHPNWHHFSIAERVDFLAKAARSPELIARYQCRLVLSKAVFVAAVLAMLALPEVLPVKAWQASARINLSQLYIDQLASRGEQRPEWYLALAQILAENKAYGRAFEVYEQALALSPEDPEVLNGMAWLYATADDPAFRDPQEALQLALEAVRRRPAPHILDTLAESLFLNGYVERAIATEEEALRLKPTNSVYYRDQLTRFRKALNSGAGRPSTEEAPQVHPEGSDRQNRESVAP